MTMDEDYERYLEKYCNKHKISKEEAEKHELLQEVKKHYEQKDVVTKMVGWKENDT